MKLSQFRKLIREEVRKIVKEGPYDVSNRWQAVDFLKTYQPYLKVYNALKAGTWTDKDVKDAFDIIMDMDVRADAWKLRVMAAYFNQRDRLFLDKVNAKLQKARKNQMWSGAEPALLNKYGFSL